MKIVNVDDVITFDNGNYIRYYHYQDCCEYNYPDFEALDDIALNYDYDENLIFEPVTDYGFCFGDSRQMFFVPCYSLQNGYYSSDVSIFYCNKQGNTLAELTVLCEWVDF